MRRKYNRPSRPRKRRSKLKASNAGPVLALSATILGILGTIALLLFVVLPKVLPLVGISMTLPWMPTPTPVPTAAPTPTPHPVASADLTKLQNEIVLNQREDYKWLGSPSVCGDTIVFAGGTLKNGTVYMDALFQYSMQDAADEKLSAPLENDAYYYPVVNENWIVYMDGKLSGGGRIMAMPRDNSARPVKVKDVYVGHPVLHLDGDYLAWTEQTGTNMDKLFLCDLTSLETATVQMFNKSEYGLSQASISGGELIYADASAEASSEEAEQYSAIYATTIASGQTQTYYPHTYVHDPMTNGTQWLWIDSNHGPEKNLYYSQGGLAPTLIASGITDYGLCDTFAAYSKNETIYVYFFDDRTTHAITPERESVQLLNVSENHVVWMDVTSRERDIMKYAAVE